MKIAAITDDGQTISQHFGRAGHYVVCTVEDGQVTEREMRSKAGHRDFVHEDDHQHGHDHEHGHGHEQGHGFGAGAGQRHARMIDAITDCDVVLVRGMGRGAYRAMEEANIEAIVTDIASIDEAVQAYIDGEIVNHIEWLH